MNKEYIERDAVIKLREEFWKDRCDYMAVRVTNIMNIPASDVVPVRHGRWYDEDSFRLTQQEGGLHYAPIYRCSVCNKTVADNYISEHKYCLHCGAKMDGGKPNE